MISSRLKLNKIQKEYIEDNYNVDIENPSFPYPGMSSITNLDVLISAVKYDKEHNYPNYPEQEDKEVANLLCNEILEIAQYYKIHNGRSLVKGYDVETICSKVDELSLKTIDTPIENEIFRIDQLINYLRNIKKELTEDVINAFGISLGIKFGETMLQISLLEKDYDWINSKDKKYPILYKDDDTETIDPIGFVQNKLKYDNSNQDHEGSCTDFFDKYNQE